MQFVPGTHRGEVVAHQLINPDSADGLRVVDPASVGTGVACPLPPGGATIHAGRTLHYAGPNSTDEPRRALIMAFRTTADLARGRPDVRLAARRLVRQTAVHGLTS